MPTTKAERHGISVVIPLFNGREFIAQTLDSITAQTSRPEEMIVADDRSPDDSVAIVQQWTKAAQVPVQILSTERNSGSPGKPTNLGIAHAKGELIAVLDQDDEFLPGKLEAVVDLFEKQPDLVCVVHLAMRGDAPRRYGNLSQARFVRDPMARRHPLGDGCYRIPSRDATVLCLRHGMFASGYPGFVFRRSAWEKIGGVNESMRVASDFDFLFALARLGDFGFIDRPLYRKRVHGQNLANKSTLGFLEVIQSIRRKIEESPDIARLDGAREAIAWRVTETAWNVAAFGQLRLAFRILRQVRATFGWTLTRQLQTLAVPVLPLYRHVFMRTCRPAAGSVFRSIEEECDRLLSLVISNAGQTQPTTLAE